VTPANSENLHLQDELLIIRHSGEIPEVALHGAIFFLTADQEGPGLDLAPDELLLLKKMVVERYREIIARDLEPDNRDKNHYRGLARCLCNWQRLKKFCRREGFATDPFRKEVASALITFLKNELSDISAGRRVSSLNCTVLELTDFIKELRISCNDLPAGWGEICLAI
jgi:hypothetical protein